MTECLHNGMNSLSRRVLVMLGVVVGCGGLPSARPAGLGDTPYSVVVRSHSVCSGALTGPRYVVTAAHCLRPEMQWNSSLSPVTVIAGSLSSQNLEQEKGGLTQSLLSESVFFYPSYSTAWAEHDIAVIKLRNEFNLTSEVGLVPLSSLPWGNSSRLCEVSGFGKMQKGVYSSLDYRLKTHVLNITKSCPCESQLIKEKGYNRVQSWLCSELGSYSGPCKGDSGAPLVCDGRLWGVTSSTFYIYDPQTCNMSREPEHPLCGTVHELNIFMDIHPYQAWIEKLMTSPSSLYKLSICLIPLCVCVYCIV